MQRPLLIPVTSSLLLAGWKIWIVCSLKDLSQWYQTWYAPNNATLVVAGDVQPEQVLRWAKQYFGPLKPSRIEPPKPRLEVEHMGERRITVKAPASALFVNGL